MIKTIASKDGTPIAYRRSGRGPSLILAHGTGASHARWAAILPALEPHFSLITLVDTISLIRPHNGCSPGNHLNLVAQLLYYDDTRLLQIEEQV